MMSEEVLSPGLIKGRLLTESGGYARIFEGLYNGNPIVIKQAKSRDCILNIQKEHEFLLHPHDSVTAQFSDYGIPSDWRLHTRFINLIPEAVTPQMLQKGITVLEKVAGMPLSSNSDLVANMRLPRKFHFAAILGWVELMNKLKNTENIALDTNIDTDLFMNPDVKYKILNVVRLDCEPLNGMATDFSKMRNPRSGFIPSTENSHIMTNEQASIFQTIQSIVSMWPQELHRDFLDSSVTALSGRFRDGIIKDSETFFGQLKRITSRAKWDNPLIIESDNAHLRQWVGVTFNQ
jgi:hypothetical protein